MGARNKNIFAVALNYVHTALVCIYEANSLRDKFALIIYYLNTPIFLVIYLFGKKHSHRLHRGIYLRNNYGLFFCGDDARSVFGLCSINESRIREFIRIQEGVAVDIGANLGMYTISLGKEIGNRGKVVAIEAEKYNFDILCKNISLNKLKNVVAINKGCFSKKGAMDLYLGDDGCGNHSFIKQDVGHRKRKVQVNTLDNIISSLGLRRVDLIKIDVEGAELAVLKGAKNILKKYHPKIVLEAWDESYLSKITDFLKPLQYKSKQLDRENYLFEAKV